MPVSEKIVEGDFVETRLSRPMAYSGYGSTPEHLITKGRIGTVSMVDIVPVRSNRRQDLIRVEFGFFIISLPYRFRVEAAYYPDEVRKLDPMSPDVAIYRLARYQAFHFRCPECKTFAYAEFDKVYKTNGDLLGYYRVEKDGRSYELGSYRELKKCCSRLLQVRMVSGTYDQKVPCGRTCMDAKSRECVCECGGLMHGINHSKW